MQSDKINIYGILHTVGLMASFQYYAYNFLDASGISYCLMERLFEIGSIWAYFCARVMCLIQGDILLRDFHKVYQGGLSVFGAFFGLPIYVVFISHFIGSSVLYLFDSWLSALCIQIIFGRIANYCKGELIGKYSTTLGRRHPSQLYQCFSEGVLIMIALAYFKHTIGTGIIMRLMPSLYCVARICNEFFREEDPNMPALYRKYIRNRFGIKLPQFNCILVVIYYWSLYLIFG